MDFFDLSKDLARLIPRVSVTVKFSPPLGRPSNKRTCDEHKSETEGGGSKPQGAPVALSRTRANKRTQTHWDRAFEGVRTAIPRRQSRPGAARLLALFGV